MSEFQSYKSILFPVNGDEHVQSFLKSLPKGSRICHRTLTDGGLNWDDKAAVEASLVPHDTWVDGQPGEILHFGIPREPDDFIKEATSKGHPRDLCSFSFQL